MGSVLLTNVTLLGFSACIAQVVLVREILHLFAGNDVVIGLFLSLWLVLTGLGARVFRGSHVHSVATACLVQAVAGVSLPLSAIALRYYRGVIGAGVLPGPDGAVVIATVMLAPFCLLSGWLLAFYAQSAAVPEDSGQSAGRVYAWDSWGAITGGMLLTFALFGRVQPIDILVMLGLANLAGGILSALSYSHRRLAVGLTVALVAILVGVFSTDVERISARAMYPGFRLLERTVTPYGTLDTLKKDGQITVLETGSPIAVTLDYVSAEETVHFALAQHPHPETVLLISGGVEGAAGEAALYPLIRLDYVEADPAVLRLADSLKDTSGIPVLNAVTMDARQLVSRTRAEYDVILSAMPAPLSAQINRYYSAEFFALARRALKKDGVIGLRLPGMENYADPRLQTLHSSVYTALKENFANVLIIPGARTVFIASDRSLSADIGGLLARHGIATRSLNDAYLTARLTKDRMAQALALATSASEANRDLSPKAISPVIERWLESAGGGLALIALVTALVALLAGLITTSPRPVLATALASSGFSAMAVEIAVLAAFQAMHGSVYHHLSLLFTAFMGGAAFGSALIAQRPTAGARFFGVADLSLGITALATAGVLVLPVFSDAVLPAPAFAVILAVTGFFSSAQIPASARAMGGGAIGGLYAVDFTGAALGAIATGVWIIPAFGVIPALVLTGIGKLVSAVAVSLKGNSAGQRSPVFGHSPWPFAVTMALLVLIGALAVIPQTLGDLYALSFARWYQVLVVLLVILELARAGGLSLLRFLPTSVGGNMLRRVPVMLFPALKMPVSRWLTYVVLAVAGFLPLIRCYFKIPWLFCHVCPRQCAFGVFRPWLVPSALVMNLEKKSWCTKVCPIGTLYHTQTLAGGKSIRIPGRAMALIAAVFLAFTVYSYFRLDHDKSSPPGAWDWYTALFNNAYASSTAVMLTATALIVAGWRWRRSFCTALCPIGSCASLTSACLDGKSRTDANAKPEAS